jgi:hypothetical protein
VGHDQRDSARPAVHDGHTRRPCVRLRADDSRPLCGLPLGVELRGLEPLTVTLPDRGYDSGRSPEWRAARVRGWS